MNILKKNILTTPISEKENFMQDYYLNPQWNQSYEKKNIAATLKDVMKYKY